MDWLDTGSAMLAVACIGAGLVALINWASTETTTTRIRIKRTVTVYRVGPKAGE